MKNMTETHKAAVEALEPCPFCGKKPKVYPRNPSREGDAWTRIFCCIPSVDVCSDGDHFKRAAKKWNTRALKQPSSVEVTDDDKALDALNWFFYMLDDDGYDDALQDRWNKVTAFNEIRKHLRITRAAATDGVKS